MKIGTAFPSTFLKADDLQGRRVTVQIDNVTIEELGDERKPVLHFIGKDRGLVLNKTNAAMVTEIAGSDDTDDWHGVSVVLYPTRVDFQGKRVDAIRIDKAEAAKPASRPAPKPAAPVDADFIEDDGIPF
jgi:hypothetical protein